MFCFNCGKQIRDDSTFCQFCGAAQNDRTVANAASHTNSNGELDRNALKIYLENVLSLECIKANYKRRCDDLGYKIYVTKNDYHKIYTLRSGFSVHLYYDGQKIYIGRDGYYPFSYYTSFSAIKENGGYWKCIKDGTDSEILNQAGSFAFAHETGAGYFAKKSQIEDAKKAFLKAYASFKVEAPSVCQNNVRKKNSLQQQKNGMLKELESVDKLLKQAYDVNIIPASFRNKLHAIYYLHSFISTSQQSLTTALLHCDLDEIKKKLDKIISQQETIIIQQAVMTAQNHQLLQENQRQLKHLASIESNSNQAAQYAQIAANNAETCAWISMANYIEAHR